MKNTTPCNSNTNQMTEEVQQVYKLPSIKHVIRYNHVAARFPTKPTWWKAIKAGFYAMCLMLTATTVMKHYPESHETQRGHMHQKKRGTINKTKEWWTRTPGNLWATTKGAGGTSQCGRHQTHNVYRSNKTIPAYVQPGKQIHNGPLQKPHPHWTHEEQNIRWDVQGIQQPNDQNQAKWNHNQKHILDNKALE